MSEDPRAAFTALEQTVAAAVIGQDEVVRTLLIALLTNGNVLARGDCRARPKPARCAPWPAC
jgi:MoxR-like ATPase